MSRTNKTKNTVISIWTTICTPNKMVGWWKERNKIVYFIMFFIYISIGILFQVLWNFICFWGFLCLFLTIGIITLRCIFLFSKSMQKIIAENGNQEAAIKATAKFFKYEKSCLNFFIPLGVVLLFGIGGCSMYKEIVINPTLIWCLSLFSVIVYISIVGYLQYVTLAVYIYNIAHGNGIYSKLNKELTEYIPIRIGWLQELTKLCHKFRLAFFAIGSIYIFAFGVFCWFPKINANTSSIMFIILWFVIFCAIVTVFPIMSILEYKWIKSIVEKLKEVFLKDLINESNFYYSERNRKKNVYDSLKLRTMITTYAIQIFDSSDYPIASKGGHIFSFCISVVNFIAAVVTVLQSKDILTYIEKFL